MKRPPCANEPRGCKNEALTRINKHWVCGVCLMKVYAKVAKEKERLLFEED